MIRKKSKKSKTFIKPVVDKVKSRLLSLFGRREDDPLLRRFPVVFSRMKAPQKDETQ